MATQSYWRQTATLPAFPAVDCALTVDVVVIGAGVTGITTAHLLTRAGVRVALIDRGRVAGGDTGWTTAHLTSMLDTPLAALVKSIGEDHAQAAWDAGFAALAQIDECIRTERIACDFEWVPGYLHAAPFSDLPDSIEARVDALRQEAAVATKLGFDAFYRERIPFVDQPGVELPRQARVHPHKYLAALALAVDSNGSGVFEQSTAEDIQADPLTVTVNGHAVRCSHVVVATNNPLVGTSGLLAATMLQTKLALYTSYAVGARVPRGTVPDALFWDDADPYRYLRIDPQPDGDVLIFGGEDHKTGQVSDTRTCFTRLEEALRQHLPDATCTHRWSGQVIERSTAFLSSERSRHISFRRPATGVTGSHSARWPP